MNAASHRQHTEFSRGKSMNRRLIHSLLAAACAATPLALAPVSTAQAQGVSRPASDIVLSIGRGQLVSVPGAMTDVFVANDQVADVQVKSRSQLYVFGKAGGETTVYASNSAGQVIWSANIRVGSNIESVDQMMQLAMPDAKIAVSSVGTNTFLLTGTVASPEDAAEAQRLVEAFVGGGSSGGASKINVISRLRTATPLQVNLQVRFAEVSRTLTKQLGVNLKTIDGSSGFQFGIGRGRQGYSALFAPGTALGTNINNLNVTLPDGTTTGGTTVSQLAGATLFAGQTSLLGLNLLTALDIGEQVGLVSTLSTPNLTALSGETADFLAGGEYPIPISQGLGATSIEYKKYGVSLAYTPTVLANGRISLRVRPEVSELSSQGAVTLNGFQVPALTIRRAETTIELGSGQSFMIAGLLSNSSQNQIEKTPGVGDLPILGALFRSTSYRKGETELVIVVTPYLVNPVNANDIKLPTDGYQAPNDLQRLFGNMEGDSKSGAQRPMPSAAPTPTPANPSVGINEEALIRALAEQEKKGGKREKRNRRADAGAAKPGFNLK